MENSKIQDSQEHPMQSKAARDMGRQYQGGKGAIRHLGKVLLGNERED
jgi:hypothetical protein